MYCICPDYWNGYYSNQLHPPAMASGFYFFHYNSLVDRGKRTFEFPIDNPQWIKIDQKIDGDIIYYYSGPDRFMTYEYFKDKKVLLDYLDVPGTYKFQFSGCVGYCNAEIGITTNIPGSDVPERCRHSRRCVL